MIDNKTIYADALLALILEFINKKKRKPISLVIDSFVLCDRLKGVVSQHLKAHGNEPRQGVVILIDDLRQGKLDF